MGGKYLMRSAYRSFTERASFQRHGDTESGNRHRNGDRSNSAMLVPADSSR